MSVKMVIEIENCAVCHFKTEKRHYTSDSFEMVFDWQCIKAAVSKDGYRYIAFVDTFDPVPAIPSWCPLRVENT